MDCFNLDLHQPTYATIHLHLLKGVISLPNNKWLFYVHLVLKNISNENDTKYFLNIILKKSVYKPLAISTRKRDQMNEKKKKKSNINKDVTVLKANLTWRKLHWNERNRRKLVNNWLTHRTKGRQSCKQKESVICWLSSKLLALNNNWIYSIGNHTVLI